MKVFILILFISFLPHPALASEIGDDGLHKQPWFEATFKDIGEDIDFAREQNKRLAIMVEQRGCPFCKKMHETVWVDPEIVAYIESHYIVVQYNLFGAEEVTDLDGDVLTESESAQKWGLKFTPSVLFLPEQSDERKSAGEQAVALMPGAANKELTLSLLHWVVERGYESKMTFEEFHQLRISNESS